MQMYGRAPAAGHGQQVALNVDRGPNGFRYVAIPERHAHTFDVPPAAYIANDMTLQNRYTGCPRLGCYRTSAVCAAVDNDDGRAGASDVERCCIRRIVVCEYNRSLARAHAITINVSRYCRRRHHTGPVVIAKHQRSFERSLCQHNLPGTHPPETLPRLACHLLAEMIFVPTVPIVAAALVAAVAIPLAITKFHSDAVQLGSSTTSPIVSSWVQQASWDVQVLGLSICCGLVLMAASVSLFAWRVRRILETRLLEVVDFTEAIANKERPPKLEVDTDDVAGRLVMAVDAVAEYVWNSQEALKRDGERQQLDAQVQRALSMADTEEQALKTTRRALEHIAPEHTAQLLLSDTSRRRLLTVLGDKANEACACPVSATRECAAVRRGQSMVFWNGDALDACTKMRQRPEPQMAAVCVPLSINGQAIGVVHTPMPQDRLLTSARIDQLKTVVRHASARIGMIRALQTSQMQAETDPLTGLLNRRSLEQKLDSLSATGEPYAIAIADLDHFKSLNDNHGHQMGDRALEIFSKIMREAVRPGDLVARLGGEEFLIVFPGCRADHAVSAVDRIRKMLAAEIPQHAGVPEFTSSFGIAEGPKHGTVPSAVMERADEALYAAKKSGRDRGVVADAEPKPQLVAKAS